MRTVVRNVVFGVVLLAVVYCDSKAEEQPKLVKYNKKAVESDKKSARKTIGDPSEYGRINLAESSLYEVQPRLKSSKDLDSLIADKRLRKAEQGLDANLANRVRRHVSPWITTSLPDRRHVRSTKSGKEIIKKYKKTKPTESLASQYASSGKNIAEPASRPVIASTKVVHENSLSPNRLKRDVDSVSNVGLNANADDYYAKRRAVMERFYGRQREMAERMSRQFTTTPRNVGGYNFNLAERNDFTGDSLARNNNERSIPENNATNCKNIPRSGTYSRKKHHLDNRNCGETRRGDMESPKNEIVTGNTGQSGKVYGQCRGRIIYQHNLFLTATGFSNLDTFFEVDIDQSVCVTCVKVIKYAPTRSTIRLLGQGGGNIKLHLQGTENDGFSYIIEIWSVAKAGNECAPIDNNPRILGRT